MNEVDLARVSISIIISMMRSFTLCGRFFQVKRKSYRSRDMTVAVIVYGKPGGGTS